MRQCIYILYDEQTEYVSRKIFNDINADKMIYSPNSELTEDILVSLALNTFSKSFYIIKTDKEILFPKFRFDYEPCEWDTEYMHIWNGETVLRLIDKMSVIEDPSRYTDSKLLAGNVRLKTLHDKVYICPVFDIVFLSYDEEMADINFAKLKNRFPRTIRSHGIKGISDAHLAAARLVKTDMFYVVDADAEIVNDFMFDYCPHSLDANSVHVWHSVNPVNDLEYGYGGVKLFPTKLLLDFAGTPVDFTTTVSTQLKVMKEISNITNFNTDPFSAWRSGFREAAKLSSRTIINQDNTETIERLNIWCTKGEDREFGDFTIMGALAGAEFGKSCIDYPEKLICINDFSWLEQRFNS